MKRVLIMLAYLFNFFYNPYYKMESHTYSSNVEEIIKDIDLENNYDKSIIRYRFLDEIKFYEKKREHTKKYYNVFRFLVTTGSILLPAILSMGQMDPAKLPKHFDQITYWMTWTISLTVIACNGFLQLFSLDKNYFNYSTVVEQLKSEGWQFFGLCGKYEDYGSHQEAYKVFSKAIEGIKRKQIEQEYANGKSEGNKKKNKFDYQGELKKLTDEQTEKGEKMKQEMQDMFQKQLEDKMKQALEDKIKSELGDKKKSLADKMKSSLSEGVAETSGVKVEVTEKDDKKDVKKDKKKEEGDK